MESKSKRVMRAFSLASAELGKIKIKGRGHAPRISLSNSAVSRYAAEATDNWIYSWPEVLGGRRRYFPVELVKRAATIGKFPISTETKKVPFYKVVEISKFAAWGEPEKGVSRLREGVSCQDSMDENPKYFWRSHLLGYSLIETWQCTDFGAFHERKAGEEILDTPVSLGEEPQPIEWRTCYYCHFSNFGNDESLPPFVVRPEPLLPCAVQPLLYQELKAAGFPIAENCPDFQFTER